MQLAQASTVSPRKTVLTLVSICSSSSRLISAEHTTVIQQTTSTKEYPAYTIIAPRGTLRAKTQYSEWKSSRRGGRENQAARGSERMVCSMESMTEWEKEYIRRRAC